MKKAGRQVLSREELLHWVREHAADLKKNGLLIMAGAGDIDMLVRPVSELLR
jgi:hypothetical protein